MSHCAQLSSALSSLSSMPPPPPHTHIHSSGRDTALPPSAATMKKRPALLSPSSGEGAIFLFLPTGWQGRQLDGAQEWAQNSSGPPHIQAGGSHQG